MKINMTIQYFKNSQGIPFYKYSLSSINKKKKVEIDFVLSAQDIEDKESIEISEEEYNNLIYKMIQGHVIQ